MSKEIVGLLEKLRQGFFLILLELWVISTKKESEVEKTEKIEDAMNKAKEIEKIILSNGQKNRHGSTDIHNIIEVNNHFSRKIDEHTFKKVKCSIEKNGLINPLIVREVESGFQVVGGYLRYKACRGLRITKIPVIIKELNNKEAIELALLDAFLRDGQNNVETKWLSIILKFYNQIVN